MKLVILEQVAIYRVIFDSLYVLKYDLIWQMRKVSLIFFLAKTVRLNRKGATNS